MVGAEGGLVDAQCPLVQRQGLRVAAQSRQRLAYRVEVGGYIGVVGAEGGLVDAQCPLVQRQGLRVPA